MKKIILILWTTLFYFTSCSYQNPSTKETTKVIPYTNQLLLYGETSDKYFCNSDSIISGDAGMFGAIYLTDKGHIIYSYACMDCDTLSYLFGKYNLTDTSITYILTDEFYFPISQTDNAMEEDDYAKGKTRKIKPVKNILKKSKCIPLAYYEIFSEEDRKKAKKYLDYVPYGLFYYQDKEKDKEKYYLTTFKKIRILSNL